MTTTINRRFFGKAAVASLAAAALPIGPRPVAAIPAAVGEPLAAHGLVTMSRYDRGEREHGQIIFTVDVSADGAGAIAVYDDIRDAQAGQPPLSTIPFTPETPAAVVLRALTAATCGEGEGA